MNLQYLIFVRNSKLTDRHKIYFQRINKKYKQFLKKQASVSRGVCHFTTLISVKPSMHKISTYPIPINFYRIP